MIGIGREWRAQLVVEILYDLFDIAPVAATMSTSALIELTLLSSR